MARYHFGQSFKTSSIDEESKIKISGNGDPIDVWSKFTQKFSWRDNEYVFCEVRVTRDQENNKDCLDVYLINEEPGKRQMLRINQALNKFLGFTGENIEPTAFNLSKIIYFLAEVDSLDYLLLSLKQTI